MSLPASVAVIICAYTEKRWEDVLSAYRSLTEQSVLADEIVIVIDHNEALLHRLTVALPNARVVPNVNAQGLSGARNAGIEATTADLVLFLDDDATPDPEWIRHMTSPFHDEQVVGVGGWAVPAWDAPGRPSWFPEAFLWVVGCSYEGQSRQVGTIRNPLGCAMAFRRIALAGTAGFSDGIGRVGTHPLGCEETELSIRIGRSNPGSRIVGQPHAVVAHRVTDSRMTLKYFFSRCYWEGVSKAVVAAHVGAGAALASERTYTTRILPRAFFRGVGQALRGELSGLARSMAIAAGLVVTSAGYLRGRRSVRKATVTGPATAVGTQLVGHRPDSDHLVAETDAAITAGSSVWCTEFDLSSPDTFVPAPVSGHYARARVLVRLRGEPIQFVELPMVGAGIDAAEIVAALSDRSALKLSAAPALVCAPQAERNPKVSVVVCTRDRGPELRNCLQRLQDVRYDNLEIIIVDNAPSDARGREAFDAQVGSDARFRYVMEPSPGLSFARNRGLAEAAGEILAYTDDDVAVDANWVTGLVGGFQRRPEVACVTGLVCTATLETPAEHYFDQRVSWADSCEPRMFDLTSHADDPLYPYAAGLFGTGASMAFSTALLRELGGFDEALGAGTRAKGGEDLDMFVRVLLEGRAIAYEPSAIVWHHHRPDLPGLRRQIFGYGTGLSAFITKHLLDATTRPDLLRRIPSGIAKAVVVPRGHQSTGPRDAGGSVGSKRALIAREFAGMAMGPALYALARRSNRANVHDRAPSAS